MSGPGRPAVFLDRDGTIGEAPPPGGFVVRPEAFRLIPGVAEALARLQRAGLALVVVTNQSCIARGLATEDDVAAVHSEMRRQLAASGVALDAVYHCPSLDPDDPDRKPNPGMIERAIAGLGLDRARSVMVGDSTRDVEAGRAAGAGTVLVTEQSAPGEPDRARAVGPDAVFGNLPEAVDWILERTVGRNDGGA